ncbi:hypothetical protein H8D85_02565 [bacterium]|nr:hypothetical protein [bacterium]
MALRTRHITCELYLEGINVPFSSVSIAEKMGTPPSCNISFPVTSKALKILAGTTVHVFGTTEMKVDGGDIEVQEILLFEGEVSGFGYSKTAQGKSLSVTAESLMHKWATVYKQSSDIVTNSTFTNALLVITSTQSLIDSLDKIVKDSKEKDLESLNSKTLKDALAKMYDFDYSSTDGFGGFFSFFQTAWKSDEKAKERGDWYPLFVGFIKHIEILNYYYSMVAKSFKLSDTIFCFPNKELKDTLELLVGNAIVGGQSGHMGNSTTLLAMLAKMLDFVHYRSIFPASPTYTYHPTAPNNLRVPMRTYFLPDLK